MRQIAIEISKSSVWLAVGSVSGGRVQLEHLLHRSLDAGADAGKVLAEMVKSAGVRGGKATAVIRRADTEVRVAALPSKELNELPDMVRFSASRLFAVAGETWPIDFLVLSQSSIATGTDTVEQTVALVMAISPTIVNQLKGASAAAGLELQSIVLAPVVMANAVLRSGVGDVDASKSFLVVDGYEGGSELTICSSGKVHFVRNVRTPLALDNDGAKLLAGEIKRTAMAASDADPPTRFDSIVTIDVAPEQIDALSTHSKLPVATIDAQSFVSLEKLAPTERENVSIDGWLALALSFAEPNIGKLERPIDSKEVDFLNPRRPVIKKRSVPQMIAVGSAAAFLILGGLFGYLWSHSSLNAEIETLQAQINSNKPTVTVAQNLISNRNAIDNFVNSKINWLDELAYISKKALPAEKAVIVGSMNVVTMQNNNDAKVTFTAAVLEHDDGPEFERSLRGDKHSVATTGWSRSPIKDVTYPYVGLTTVVVPAGTVTTWKESEATPVQAQEEVKQ